MPETFQSLAVVVLALLPALYVWAFERQAGAWGIKLSDRLFRFVGFSAILHALFAPVTYALWDEFIRSGRVSSGQVSLSLWLVPLVYIGLPVVIGSIIGRGIRNRMAWASSSPAQTRRREPGTISSARLRMVGSACGSKRDLAWRGVRPETGRLSVLCGGVSRGPGSVSARGRRRGSGDRLVLGRRQRGAHAARFVYPDPVG